MGGEIMLLSITLTVSDVFSPDTLKSAEIIWIPIIVAVLSSSVIVGIFQFIQWSKDRKTSNITSERKEWRNYLRDIAEGLQVAESQPELDLLLTKLKVRINPKGMINNSVSQLNIIEKAESFKKDCYIWKIIRDLESPTDSFCQKKELIQGLIESISILIKYDWDRSKEEITSSKYGKCKIYFYTYFTLLLISIITYISLSEQSNLTLFILIALFVILPLLIQYIRYYITKKIDMNKNIIESNYKIDGYIKRSLYLNNQISTFIIYIILLFIYSVISVNYYYEIGQNQFQPFLIIDLFLMIVFAVLFYFKLGRLFIIGRFYTIEYYITLTEDIFKRLSPTLEEQIEHSNED